MYIMSASRLRVTYIMITSSNRDVHYECIASTLRVHYEHVRVLWVRCDYAWVHHEYIMSTLWVHHEYIMSTHWVHHDCVLCVLRAVAIHNMLHTHNTYNALCTPQQTQNTQTCSPRSTPLFAASDAQRQVALAQHVHVVRGFNHQSVHCTAICSNL